MSKASVWLLAAASYVVMASPALARHHVHSHHHARYHHVARHSVPHGAILDVLVANPYGDVIIDGKTGYHRSTFGVMVPDSQPASIIATGRASGSGLGANGLPGINWQ